MLEARGIETHLLPISGRGPVVFGKLNAPDAKRTVIFYAHYDGQPVDPAAWTDGKPFEPVLRSDSIEAGGKRIPLPKKRPGAYNDNWRIYARSASDDKGGDCSAAGGTRCAARAAYSTGREPESDLRRRRRSGFDKPGAHATATQEFAGRRLARYGGRPGAPVR